MIDKKIIKIARQANLAEYLLSAGVPLVKIGKRYRHKEHDSLVFTDNTYYWNSRQEHGNSIDYLVRHMNMKFKDAISALTNVSVISDKQKSQTANKTFELDRTTLYFNCDKVKDYLNKTRFIGRDVINNLIENKLLYQERETNNAIFPIYDEENNIVGAEVQGTLEKKRFKGIKPDSKYGYGFNARFSDDNIYDYALFFESAVDLMSFIDYKMNHEKKSLNKCILISMSGLKINIVKHMLKAFKGKLQPVICVDNDKAGRTFIKSLDEGKICYITCLPEEKFKDWNEQLLETKRNSKIIMRLNSKHSLTDRNKDNRNYAENKDPNITL